MHGAETEFSAVFVAMDGEKNTHTSYVAFHKTMSRVHTLISAWYRIVVEPGTKVVASHA